MTHMLVGGVGYNGKNPNDLPVKAGAVILTVKLFEPTESDNFLCMHKSSEFGNL